MHICKMLASSQFSFDPGLLYSNFQLYRAKSRRLGYGRNRVDSWPLNPLHRRPPKESLRKESQLDQFHQRACFYDASQLWFGGSQDLMGSIFEFSEPIIQGTTMVLGIFIQTWYKVIRSWCIGAPG